MRRATAWLIFTATSLLLGVVFLWPLSRVVGGGFVHDGHFTLRYLAGVFRNPIYAEGLRNSLLLGLGTTAIALLIALPPR